MGGALHTRHRGLPAAAQQALRICLPHEAHARHEALLGACTPPEGVAAPNPTRGGACAPPTGVAAIYQRGWSSQRGWSGQRRGAPDHVHHRARVCQGAAMRQPPRSAACSTWALPRSHSLRAPSSPNHAHGQRAARPQPAICMRSPRWSS